MIAISPKKLAGAELGQHLALAAHDLHLAFDDDEELVRGAALAHDHLARVGVRVLERAR